MNDDLKWLAENVHEWKEGAIWLAKERDILMWWYGDIKPVHIYVCSRGEWQAARDELSGKPGWDLAPDWARIRVQSSLGNWFFGDHKNTKPSDESEWVASGGKRWSKPFRGRVLGDWRNTLERRPEALPVNDVLKQAMATYGPIIKRAPDPVGHPTASPLRQFALSQIRAASDCCITDDDVRAVFINLVTELDDEALAGVAGRVVK